MLHCVFMIYMQSYSGSLCTTIKLEPKYEFMWSKSCKFIFYLVNSHFSIIVSHKVLHFSKIYNLTKFLGSFFSIMLMSFQLQKFIWKENFFKV